jgi:hypothetical protein
MFRASLCPSSWAYQPQQQPLVYCRNVVVAVLLFVVGPVEMDRPQTAALLRTCSYGKPVAAAAVDRLMMMGIRIPGTCWAVSKWQAINLLLIAASSWLIRLDVWGCTDLQTLNLHMYNTTYMGIWCSHSSISKYVGSRFLWTTDTYLSLNSRRPLQPTSHFIHTYKQVNNRRKPARRLRYVRR